MGASSILKNKRSNIRGMFAFEMKEWKVFVKGVE